jgi:hypothetical protein
MGETNHKRKVEEKFNGNHHVKRVIMEIFNALGFITHPIRWT